MTLGSVEHKGLLNALRLLLCEEFGKGLDHKLEYPQHRLCISARAFFHGLYAWHDLLVIWQLLYQLLQDSLHLSSTSKRKIENKKKCPKILGIYTLSGWNILKDSVWHISSLENFCQHSWQSAFHKNLQQEMPGFNLWSSCFQIL